MNDRYRQARRYWARHWLFNNNLALKMLIWGMRRAKNKSPCVLD